MKEAMNHQRLTLSLAGLLYVGALALALAAYALTLLAIVYQ